MLSTMKLSTCNYKVNHLMKVGAGLIFIFYGFFILTAWSATEQTNPLGEDFSIFWTASKLSRAGNPLAAYDLSKLQDTQQSLLGKKTPPGCGWYYPPHFLLMSLPLSLLPYVLSLGVWLSLTISAYLVVVRSLAPHPLTIWLTLAFPATFWNLFYGQNGFLSAALLGGGLLLLNYSPILAGILLGLMSYKPQLAVLIFVALIAGRFWKTLIVAIITILALIISSVIIFGYDTWIAFYTSIAYRKKLLESGNLISYQFIPTFFSVYLLLGYKTLIAYLYQIILILLIVITIYFTWSKKGLSNITASLLVLGSLLSTHFCCLYDLTLLALPLAWLGWDGYIKGWLFGEKTVLAIAWFSPLLYFILKGTELQLIPFIILALFIVALRRFVLTIRLENKNTLRFSQ
jgi:hypothetical protein